VKSKDEKIPPHPNPPPRFAGGGRENRNVVFFLSPLVGEGT